MTKGLALFWALPVISTAFVGAVEEGAVTLTFPELGCQPCPWKGVQEGSRGQCPRAERDFHYWKGAKHRRWSFYLQISKWASLCIFLWRCISSRKLIYASLSSGSSRWLELRGKLVGLVSTLLEFITHYLWNYKCICSAMPKIWMEKYIEIL